MKRRLVAVLAAFGFAGILAASDSPFGMDATTLRKLARSAPYRASFPGGVSFRLPDDLRFVTEDKLTEFADRMRLALAGDELGAIVPNELTWYTMIYQPKTDPLEGQTDLAQLNKEKLTTWLEKFTADHTPRKPGAGKTWRLGNWTHPASYDADKKMLTLGVWMTNDDLGDTSHRMMNYLIFLYGSEKQIICLQTIAPLSAGAWEKPVDRAKKLVDEVHFPEVFTPASEHEEMMYYAKIVGVGLIGTVIVVVLSKLMVGNRRRPAPTPLRRPGLPR